MYVVNHVSDNLSVHRIYELVICKNDKKSRSNIHVDVKNAFIVSNIFLAKNMGLSYKQVCNYVMKCVNQVWNECL